MKRITMLIIGLSIYFIGAAMVLNETSQTKTLIKQILVK